MAYARRAEVVACLALEGDFALRWFWGLLKRLLLKRWRIRMLVGGGRRRKRRMLIVQGSNRLWALALRWDQSLWMRVRMLMALSDVLRR